MSTRHNNDNEMSELTEKEINESIWPPAVIFYVHAMLFNIRAALGSLEMAGDAMGLIPGSKPTEPIDQDFVLNHLQNAIIHAAAISRYLWPSKGKGAANRKTQARGANLRRRLKIDDTNPLSDRNLRNAIEHFDERLDEYLGEGIVGMVLPHYVGPSLDDSEVPGHTFRAFYTDTLVFKIVGEHYEIPPLIDALHQLEEALEPKK